MNLKLILTGFILFSCKSTPSLNQDTILRLIEVHQNEQVDLLISSFGQPNQIEDTEDKETKKYIYEFDSEKFITWVNINNKTISNTVYFLWKSNDDYEYLKQKLGHYKWIEKYKPTKTHQIRELYDITIPEIGVSFEYDRLSPKILDIYFSKPEGKK